MRQPQFWSFRNCSTHWQLPPTPERVFTGCAGKRTSPLLPTALLDWKPRAMKIHPFFLTHDRADTRTSDLMSLLTAVHRSSFVTLRGSRLHHARVILQNRRKWPILVFGWRNRRSTTLFCSNYTLVSCSSDCFAGQFITRSVTPTSQRWHEDGVFWEDVEDDFMSRWAKIA